jgi:acetyl esterase/lipase
VKRLPYMLRIAAAAVFAVFRATIRRLRGGPTLPSWTWSEEVFVAASRATAFAAARDIARMAPRHGGMRVPLSGAVRRALTVERVDLDGVRAERFRPHGEVAGTILYFHGGGFVSGGVGLERRPAAANALASRCDTFSVDYRLAPRHPFPAALDDAVAAYRAILDRGADPSTTVLFGGSAGACLALATLLRIRADGLATPAGAVLLWPYADFTFAGESIVMNADIDMLPLRDLSPVWGPAYVGDADPRDPLVSPALADLTGLPPLLVIAGGAESLLSCAQQIARNAERDGVAVTLSVHPEKVHGWMVLPKLPATVQAVDEVNTWISTRIGRAAELAE